MIAALLLSASIAATPPPAPVALGGMHLGESIVDVLKELGAPDNVVTRDDAIFWQWARAGGMDREVLTGEDLIIKQILIASLPPANPTSNAVPLQGTVTPPGGEPVTTTDPNERAWRVGDDVVVASVSNGAVWRLVAYQIPSGPPPLHRAVRVRKTADIGSLPHGAGLAVYAVDVDAAGNATDVRLLVRSGDSAVDDWVIQDARHTQYDPATCSGVPCAGVFVDVDGILKYRNQ